jgi:hypothetical protein
MTPLNHEDMTMKTCMTPREIAKLNENYEFWLQFEYANWKLIAFTDRISARFGWMHSSQFTRYVEIKVDEANFLSGVDPDVLDQL